MNKTSELLFYEIMNYPIPRYREYFSTNKKNIILDKEENFSRDEKDPLMDEYCNYIKKHKNIFRSLPWIKDIYLCNSITFNKLNNLSDIDIFIVTKRGCLRRARFASAFIFLILGLKRFGSKIRKKYCLSFYVTENSQNLYSISIQSTDIYLAYRLTHLVPIYKESIEDRNNIYKNNSRVSSILPNIPQDKNIINLNIPIYTGKTKIKSIIEKYIGGGFGRIVEYLIKILRVPILIYKTKRLKEVGKDIIFNDNMLKFYKDKRKKISLLYRSRNSSQ